MYLYTRCRRTRGVQIYEDYREISANNPVASFAFTPYRGTCTPEGVNLMDGKSHLLKKNNMQKSLRIIYGHYELDNYDLRVRIVAIKETGGISFPAPKSLPIFDPFYQKHTNKIIPNKPYGFPEINW